jgi:UDP-4-amino-4,6-dideoxy-N-acetyl-beta-L-altrosamine N-acetyltransferase
MYSDHTISPDEHVAWFKRALTAKDARFLIFEIGGRPLGFVSFTNISELHERCTWAFYIGEADAPKGSGSAMEYFAIDYAFNKLNIRKLCCEVFSFNEKVIKLHGRFGFVAEGHFLKHYKKNGNFEDIVCLAKFADLWPQEKDELKRKCFGADS